MNVRTNARTERHTVAGPAGAIECAIDRPEASLHAAPRGVALLCHPHPLHGGTMDNKVVMTLARAALQRGWVALRFNFRGVGGSAGAWGEGPGEVDDALAVLAARDHLGLPTDVAKAPPLLAGFSFGGYVASQVAARLAAAGTPPAAVLLVAPAVVNFSVAALPPGSGVIHGEADEVVPLAAVLDWARAAPQPVTVLPGAGHFFHGQLTLLKQMALGALAASDALHPNPNA